MGSDVEVTEADREKAMQIMAWDPLSYDDFARAVKQGGDPDDRDSLQMVDEIAQALAEERAKAQAPFLALADELGTDNDDPGFEASPDYWAGLSEAADRIRRAAGEG